MSRREREALEAMIVVLEHDVTAWSTEFRRRLRDVSRTLNDAEGPRDLPCRGRVVD